MIFFEPLFKILINFLHTWHQSTYQYQTVSYMSVTFTKKNHFFGSHFFHQHVILFSYKKREKKLPVVIFMKKFRKKKEKNMKICHISLPMWEIFKYGWSWEKWYNIFEKFHFRCFANKFIKFSIANMKIMNLTTVNTYQFSSVLKLIILLIIY